MDIKILFGSETGNSETLAIQTEKELTAAGFNASAVAMDAINAEDLAKLNSTILVITSTWGDGEAPSNAQDLYAQLEDGDFDFSNLKFAVLGIGQSMFDNFCKAAIDFDALFEKQKATRLADIVLCDDDFDEKLPTWIEAIKSKLS